MFKFKKLLALIILLPMTFMLTNCSYGQKSQLTSQDENAQLATQYEYDDSGQLVSIVSPDSSKIQMKYNEMGLPVEIEYPEGLTRYGYNENGKRIWVKDNSGISEYYYDAFDRLVGLIWQNKLKKMIIYTYDTCDNLTGLSVFDIEKMGQNSKYKNQLALLTSDPSDNVQQWRDQEVLLRQVVDMIESEDIREVQKWQQYSVRYGYDVLGNITEINTNGESIFYSYKPDTGTITRRLPNGITTDVRYLANGLLESVSHQDINGQIIAEYTYEHNAAGKVTKVNELTADGLKVTGFSWNTLGYLSEITLPDGEITKYDYDEMGNRISNKNTDGIKQYTYDGYGRLIQAGGDNYGWDKNGNLISQTEDKKKTSIKYNSKGLPIFIKAPDSITVYKWDADGNMFASGTGKETIYYLPNPLALPGFTLAEFDETGALKNSYLYGDTLIGQTDNDGNTQFFLEDGFNSIRNIADNTGELVGQMDYTPFAEPYNITGETEFKFRTAGERLLPEINKYFVGNRLYDSATGRYLSPDPEDGYLERFDSFNKYTHGEPDTDPQNIRTEKVSIRGVGEVGPLLDIPGTRTIQTSYFRNNMYPGIVKTDGFIQVVDILRAMDNYLSSYIPGINGTNKEVWEKIISDPKQITSIEGFSNGGITVYRLREYIVKAIKDGTLSNLKEISLPGTGLQQAMRNYLKKAGITNVIVKDDIWSPGVLFDPVRIFTTPIWDNILYISPWRYCVAVISLLQGNLKYHTTDKVDDDRAFLDPFDTIEKQLGGVKISPNVEFIGELGNITGAVYDPEKELFVLLSDENQGNEGLSISAEDFAVALKLVFGENSQDAQFTLDPFDPENPRGELLRAVYIPDDILSDTSFGKALFDADWLLKQYSFGVKVDENGNITDRENTVEGFKSIIDLIFEAPNDNDSEETWSRFWITPDIVKLKQSGNTIEFDTVTMRVNAKKIIPDPSAPQGFRDVEANSPVATEFAEIFTSLYDQISIESPEFERIRDLTKAVAIAKWMKRNNIPVDMDWVDIYSNKQIETVDSVGTLSITKDKTEEIKKDGVVIGTLTRTVSLFGGVGLIVNPEYIEGSTEMSNLEEDIYAELDNTNAQGVFTVEEDGKQITATVIPLTKSGQELYENSALNQAAPTEYEYNEIQQVIGSKSEDGSTGKYEYASDGKLQKVSLADNNGWKAAGEKNDAGSRWVITNPKGDEFSYIYDSSGYLSSTELNGKTWSLLERSNDGSETIVKYGDYTEKINYDNNGIISNYEISKEDDGNTTITGLQTASFSYNNYGSLVDLRTDGNTLFNISYMEDNISPLKIETPQTQIQFSYDDDGSINAIKYADSSYSVNSDSGTEKLQINFLGENAEYVFGKDGVTQSKDFLGEKSEFAYKDGNLISVRLEPGGEAKYAYDSLGRLTELRFPNGSWTEYQFEGDNNSAENSASLKMTVTVIKHPAQN
jgi:YD repeat-containing protein